MRGLSLQGATGLLVKKAHGVAAKRQSDTLTHFPAAPPQTLHATAIPTATLIQCCLAPSTSARPALPATSRRCQAGMSAGSGELARVLLLYGTVVTPWPSTCLHKDPAVMSHDIPALFKCSPEGTYRRYGMLSTHCWSCPPGTFSAAGASSCRLCEPGTATSSPETPPDATTGGCPAW